jgi:hypothetical protein
VPPHLDCLGTHTEETIIQAQTGMKNVLPQERPSWMEYSWTMMMMMMMIMVVMVAVV